MDDILSGSDVVEAKAETDITYKVRCREAGSQVIAAIQPHGVTNQARAGIEIETESPVLRFVITPQVIMAKAMLAEAHSAHSSTILDVSALSVRSHNLSVEGENAKALAILSRLDSGGEGRSDQRGEWRGAGRYVPVLRGTYAEKQEARRKRALSRFFKGSGLQGRLLVVTLTTPEWFKGDMHDAWRLFTWRIRRRGLWREYFAVKEMNERKTCCHLHVVFRTDSELGSQAIRAQWLQACKASDIEACEVDEPNAERDSATFVWTHHSWLRDISSTARYLGKYLGKAPVGKRAYWYAYGWLARGYIGFGMGAWCAGRKLDDTVTLAAIRGSRDPAATMFAMLVMMWNGKEGVMRSQGRWRKEVEICAKRAGYPAVNPETKGLRDLISLGVRKR